MNGNTLTIWSDREPYDEQARRLAEFWIASGLLVGLAPIFAWRAATPAVIAWGAHRE